MITIDADDVEEDEVLEILGVVKKRVSVGGESGGSVGGDEGLRVCVGKTCCCYCC